jgi:hypothetical protein
MGATNASWNQLLASTGNNYKMNILLILLQHFFTVGREGTISIAGKN